MSDRAERDRWWRTEFETALERTGDVVAALSEVRETDALFGAQNVRAGLVVRDVLGLSIRQSHYVAGWLAGSVADDVLREQVSPRP